MRIDWYTKGVLTVIAALLGVIAIRPYASPDAVAHAQGSFAGVEYNQMVTTSLFFDTRTGDLWTYNEGKVTEHARLSKLGAPMVIVK